MVEKAIFAAGCFWHVEEVFSKLPGVLGTKVGYIGGILKNPTYEQVSSGNTNYAEAIEITFNPIKISYEKLLDIFWEMHDPTTLNKQGPDVGTNYRSSIFYLDENQKQIALKSKQEFQKKLDKPIVTKIVKATDFYPAEEYHQKYFDKHRSCHI